MQSGTYISGVGHGALILWALLGGFFLSAQDPLPVQTSDVSLISGDQFAALALPDTAPDPQQDLAQPAPPQLEDTAPTPPPETNDTPAIPVPDTNPTLPDAVPDAPPKPAPAPRIAPLAAPAPPPDAEVSEQVTPEVVPEEGGQEIAEPAPATAPEEATTEIVTEAEQPAAAPKASPRPLARPSPPVQTAETDPEPAADPLAQALAEAVASDDTPAPARPTGPPLTGGEKDALRVAVQKCWNVAALSSEALQTTVVVGVSMQRNGTPMDGKIRLLSHEGGSQSAAQQAFEFAQRAIRRWGLKLCGDTGFTLPPEKFSHWQEMELTFNPERMRIK